MSNFMLLYTGGTEGMPESDEEFQAVMAAWGVWYEKLGAAVVDGGNPISPAAKTVSSDGSVSDGAVGPAATGYTIISGDSLADAAEKAKGCPVLADGGQISVYEIVEVGDGS